MCPLELCSRGVLRKVLMEGSHEQATCTSAEQTVHFDQCCMIQFLEVLDS